ATAGPGFGEAIQVDADGVDAYEHVHRAAIGYIGRIEGEQAMAVLNELALHDDRMINLFAVEAIRARRDRKALPTLMAVLEHDDARQKRLDDHFARVTLQALRAIRDIGDAQAVLSLREFVQADRRRFDQD